MDNIYLIRKQEPKLRIFVSNKPRVFVDFYQTTACRSIFDFITSQKESCNYVIVFAADEEIRKINDYEFILVDLLKNSQKRIYRRHALAKIFDPTIVCFASHERLGSFYIDRAIKLTKQDVENIWRKIIVRVKCNKYL